MRLTSLPALFAFLLTPVAQAAQGNYLDDRSTPSALVQSFYNAIDRGEYARALGYFAVPPAEGVEGFAAAIGDFRHFRVVTGQYRQMETGDGEGVIELPVAVEMIAGDGEASIAAGCYTILAPGPTGEDGGFLALRIASGELDPVDTRLEDALPTRCGDGPELPATDVTAERASDIFTTAFADVCAIDDAEPDQSSPTDSWVIEISIPSEGLEPEVREAQLFQFLCGSGAYNSFHVYLFSDRGEIRPVNFPMPELDIRYEDEESREEVRSIDVIGFISRPDLVNSQYDPDTLTMTSRYLWRGPGDAAASGTWIFRSGTFTLVRYEVDASYDGQINPKTVVDYLTGP